MNNPDQKPDLVRKPHYAGKSYPKDPVELSESINTLLSSVCSRKSTEYLRVLVVPCAGELRYDDNVVAALQPLKKRTYVTVIVVAAAVNTFFDHVSVFSGGGYDTPLGRVFVDLELAKRMASIHPRVVFSDYGHTGGRKPESVIEALLPLLQIMIGNFKLLPVVIGDQELDNAKALGEVLAAIRPGNETLLLACANTTFPFGSDSEQKQALGVEQALARLDWRQLNDRLSTLRQSGAASLLSLIYACQRLGITTATIKRLSEISSLTEAGSNQTITLSVTFTREHLGSWDC